MLESEFFSEATPASAARQGVASASPVRRGMKRSGTLQSEQPSNRRRHLAASSSDLVADAAQNSTAASSSDRRHFRDNTRLRLALVELMQELFMESMRDGELSSYERNTLQMAAIVLSQVNKKHGKDMNVSMAGDAMDKLEATFPEVVEFMSEVSSGMKEHFLALKAKGTRARKREDNSVPMRGLRKGLEWVLGATGTDVQEGWQVTSEELLACCQEEDEEEDDSNGHISWLLLAGAIGWIMVAYRAALSCWSALWHTANQHATAGLFEFTELMVIGFLWAVQLVGLAVLLDWLGLLKWLGQHMSRKFMMKSRFFDMYQYRRSITAQTVRDALTFFSLCFAYVGIKSWFDVVMVFLRIRVMLCFASALPLLGRVVYPLCFFAEHVMEWKKDHWLLGCLESGKADSEVGAMSWAAYHLGSTVISFLCIPGGFCTGACILLTWSWHQGYGSRLYFVILCGLAAGAFLEVFTRETLLEEEETLKGLLHVSFFNISFEWILKVLLDFMISTGMCTAYGTVADTADRVVQPVLMLRSLKLGSDIKSAVVEGAVRVPCPENRRMNSAIMQNGDFSERRRRDRLANSKIRGSVEEIGS